jgi:rhodanese-related sulfurtransferase
MIRSIERTEVQRLAGTGALLVDVLSPSTYAKEHLPGAVNIPLRDVDRSTTGACPIERAIVVYCHDLQ